ncbi:MAG TPA: hypothetical protein VKT77_14705 [Chthonomonadaceae bacterium]|nr:hypothetical protein [Chthonomonadaceae bacterium]
MRALLVAAVTLFVAAGLGATLLGIVLGSRIKGAAALRPFERLLVSVAIGLGAIGYGVYGLGLYSLLAPGWIAGWIALCGALGVPGFRAAWTAAREQARQRANVGEAKGAPPMARALEAILSLLVAVLLLIALAACYRPPGPHEWDALAYHLADPKIFLLQHKIAVLPTEHHSNFPFTVEMLFAIGLALDGYAAANLFHLAYALILVGAVVAFCDRYLTRLAGLVAAVTLLTTPILLWEASIAYIDVALAAYVFLAAYLVIIAARPDNGGTMPARAAARIMIAAGALMGLALGVKYLALVPLVLVALLAVLRRVPIRAVVLYAITACAIGSPWYIKNTVWMRNPVYPYAFRLFPHSRYWSADRETPYTNEQKSFGTEHAISRPAESLRNLAATPWTLVARPALYTNPADFTFTSLVGGLYAALLLSLAFADRPPGPLADALLLAGGLFVSWFFISQHVRYLIPVLPFAAIGCGFAIQSRFEGAAPGRSRIVNAVVGVLAISAVFGQAALLGWGIVALPTGGRSAIDAQERGLPPTALSLPEVAAVITNPAVREHRMEGLASYGAMQWINANAPPGAGVVLYEDVLGFNLDRPYIWGNREHSSWIPYERLHSGAELSAWLREHGFRYVMINLNNAPGQTERVPDDLDIVAAALRTRYDPAQSPGKDLGWRRTIGEAIAGGTWILQYAHHGVAVLEIGADGT